MCFTLQNELSCVHATHTCKYTPKGNMDQTCTCIKNHRNGHRSRPCLFRSSVRIILILFVFHRQCVGLGSGWGYEDNTDSLMNFENRIVKSDDCVMRMKPVHDTDTRIKQKTIVHDVLNKVCRAGIAPHLV